jgi:hypothetical protein
MIRNVETCPFCDAVIAIDDDTGGIIFNPDRVHPLPCGNLTCFWIVLTVLTENGDDILRSNAWFWEYGKGLHEGTGPMSLEENQLSAFLGSYDSLPSRLIPRTPHLLIGDAAMQREQRRPGSGDLVVARGTEFVGGLLDAWVMFATQPADVMKEIGEIRKVVPL